jgi:hypothetical protein
LGGVTAIGLVTLALREIPARVAAEQTRMAMTALSLDEDGDGLIFSKELELGTDPKNPDTDGDELSDADEVNSYSTNPKNRDTDGDTLTDGAEIKTDCGSGRTLNPNSDDTDSDGEKDGVDGVPCSVATPTPTPSATPTEQPTISPGEEDNCPGSPPTRLINQTRGIVGEITVPLYVRETPAPGEQDLVTIPHVARGATFVIIEPNKPVCDDIEFLRWWHVRFNREGIEGWVAEGKVGVDPEYFIGPADPVTPTLPA